MDASVLKELGLTDGEVKVYLALVRIGSSSAGTAALSAGVSHSKVYKILGRLEKKGLVGHVIKSGTQVYSSLDPRRLLDYLDAKEKALTVNRFAVLKLLPEIEFESKQAKQRTEATLYDGFNAVTNVFRGMVDELTSGETYYVIGGGYGENVSGLHEFFYAHHRRRAKKGVRVKMLANYDVRNALEPTTLSKAEIRFLPQYLATNMEIVFYKNKVFIALWTNSPKGFLVESPDAVKSFKAYFDAFWKTARR